MKLLAAALFVLAGIAASSAMRAQSVALDLACFAAFAACWFGGAFVLDAWKRTP